MTASEEGTVEKKRDSDSEEDVPLVRVKEERVRLLCHVEREPGFEQQKFVKNKSADQPVHQPLCYSLPRK